MLTYFLILLLLLALLLWFWLGRAGAPKPPPEYSGKGTLIKIPNFKPIPFKPTNVSEPAPQNVAISVVRDGNGVPVDISVEPLDLVLNPNEQAAWSAGPSRGAEGGKLGIRFSPRSAPFGGTSFITARGGVAKSGAPIKAPPGRTSRSYTVLLTTPDGYLLRKSATLTVVNSQGEQTADQYPQAALSDSALSDSEELANKGTLIKIPGFKPLPRPERPFVEPPSKEVNIKVVRNQNGEPVDIVVEPGNRDLTPDEQVAWTTGPRVRNEGGKVEIRFAPNATPFGGAAFTTARGGVVKSGKPTGRGVTRDYLVLLTTPDGVLLEKEARVTVSG